MFVPGHHYADSINQHTSSWRQNSVFRFLIMKIQIYGHNLHTHMLSPSFTLTLQGSRDVTPPHSNLLLCWGNAYKWSEPWTMSLSPLHPCTGTQRDLIATPEWSLPSDGDSSERAVASQASALTLRPTPTGPGKCSSHFPMLRSAAGSTRLQH